MPGLSAALSAGLSAALAGAAAGLLSAGTARRSGVYKVWESVTAQADAGSFWDLYTSMWRLPEEEMRENEEMDTRTEGEEKEREMGE